MIKQITILIFIISNTVQAQHQIELRDVTFAVPSAFKHVTEQDRKFDDENFHEAEKNHSNLPFLNQYLIKCI